MVFCRLSSAMSLCLAGFLGGTSTFGQAVQRKDVTLQNQAGQKAVVLAKDGSYEIADEQRTVLHAGAAAEIDHKWIRFGDYPKHSVEQGPFQDSLGHGQQVLVTFSGLAGEPDLLSTIRLYESLVGSGIPFGEIQVEVRNSTGEPVTIQAIRPVEGLGSEPIHTGASEAEDRILSDSFSEDWPPLKIYDLGGAPGGMHRAVGSQLIYNRASGESLFFGALSSSRFLTIAHLQAAKGAQPQAISSYTIDSTGTTEIQATDPESGLKDGPKKNLIELSLPLAPGESIGSETLMFATGKNYYSLLDTYGSTIRQVFKARVDSPGLMGWWSWTAYYTNITEANTWTNAQWLSEHLKKLGFNFFHLDLGYGYARGEYATPNASRFPHGLTPLTHRVCRLGLKMGFWTAPFEVSDRSWVYENHKDWLVQNAQGEPISIGEDDEDGKEILYVLDATNPGAQEYLKMTYRTLVNDWGARYIKLDFMDNTAIEGYYYRPHTTALEAQRIGLELIRKTVGDRVLLDKDGSPMLNPVGLLDEGRLSQDTGHLFERSKEAAPGIAARYYMNHNFFTADPDAFTISRQKIEERQIEAPLSLTDARVSVTLAALAGGMFEVGDDLTTLGMEKERLALVTNRDVLQMVKLGQSAVPLDLLTYADQDEQPSVFLLKEDSRQAMLAVFNWTEQPRSHTFSFASLGLATKGRYKLTDVFEPAQLIFAKQGGISIGNQPPHTVRLIRIINEAIPAAAPTVRVTAPVQGEAEQPLSFHATADASGVPALAYHWNFGDGVSTDGAQVVHTFTRDGVYTVKLTADGVDGVPYQKEFTVTVKGYLKIMDHQRYIGSNAATAQP